jgi:hypothetical protein
VRRKRSRQGADTRPGLAVRWLGKGDQREGAFVCLQCHPGGSPSCLLCHGAGLAGEVGPNSVTSSRGSTHTGRRSAGTSKFGRSARTGGSRAWSVGRWPWPWRPGPGHQQSGRGGGGETPHIDQSRRAPGSRTVRTMAAGVLSLQGRRSQILHRNSFAAWGRRSVPRPLSCRGALALAVSAGGLGRHHVTRTERMIPNGKGRLPRPCGRAQALSRTCSLGCPC